MFFVFSVNRKLHLETRLDSTSIFCFKQYFLCCFVYFSLQNIGKQCLVSHFWRCSYWAVGAGVEFFHYKTPTSLSSRDFSGHKSLLLRSVISLCGKMAIFFLLSVKSVVWPHFPFCYWLLVPFLLFPWIILTRGLSRILVLLKNQVLALIFSFVCLFSSSVISALNLYYFLFLGGN